LVSLQLSLSQEARHDDAKTVDGGKLWPLTIEDPSQPKELFSFTLIDLKTSFKNLFYKKINAN